MADFKFLNDPVSKKWVISAPRRGKRPDSIGKSLMLCPFCPGRETEEQALYRVPILDEKNESDWLIRVIPNKFPFAKTHEIIIHSPDHHKNFDELSFSQVELLLQTYRERFNKNRSKGQVYLFHNKGGAAGESLPHPHSQLVVIPQNIPLSLTPLIREDVASSWNQMFGLHHTVRTTTLDDRKIETEDFFVFCPRTSEWPDEVWLAPKKYGDFFGDVTDSQISDLSFVLSRIIQLFDLRHGHEFPFNFYIYPEKNWYLRLIPRIKIVGGFEMGTNIIVNTQDPAETFAFIKEHFWFPKREIIRSQQQADYWKKA